MVISAAIVSFFAHGALRTSRTFGRSRGEGEPLSYRVADKMRLSKDKTRLVVNPSLTLAACATSA